MPTIQTVFNTLITAYGPQGWWPILGGDGASIYKARKTLTAAQTFEICIGAILTQSVAWSNVEKALQNLKLNDYLHIEAIHTQTHETIAECIRPSGYFNQKAKKLKNFSNWLAANNFNLKIIKSLSIKKLRNELLSIHGVGPETADSMLLYAFHKKIFVIDAYTKRIFSRIGIITGNESYAEIQDLFHQEFDKSIIDYSEYHALIVAHAKDFCKTKPICSGCCLEKVCKKTNVSKQ